MATSNQVPSTIVTINLSGQTDFNIPFEYLARKFVVVTLLGADRKVLILNSDYRFVSKTTVSLINPAPAGYTQLEIRRITSTTERLVDFYDGSVLHASDLNLAQIQTLHVAAEARDAVSVDGMGITSDGNLDARNRRIKNVAYAEEGGDAVPLGQLVGFENNAYISALRAEAAAQLASESLANINTALEPINGDITDIKARSVQLSGRTSVQIAQLTAPVALTQSSGVSQGLHVDPEADEFYMTWDGAKDEIDTVVQRYTKAGGLLATYTGLPLGHADSFSRYKSGSTNGFLVGVRGGVRSYWNGAVGDLLPVSLPNIAEGSSCLVAVDSYDYKTCAFFYRDSNAKSYITVGVPLQKVLEGTAVGELANTFEIVMPVDAVATVNFQSFALYRDSVVVWAGNDSRSGDKLLSTYTLSGNLVERLNVLTDRGYADIEGNITEPEGMCLTFNKQTNLPDVYITKCFGAHSPSQTILRVYRMAGATPDANTPTYIGSLSRDTSGAPSVKVVEFKILFEKITEGWSPNAGTTLSACGKYAVSNVRFDTPSTGIHFDLVKPYVSLMGYSVGLNAGMAGSRVMLGVSASKGGSTSNKDIRISFFSINLNKYLSANDSVFTKGQTFSLSLTVAMQL